ncbi:MAG: hypothetical protein WCP01_14185 [Methylococcaceae bacterium]
MGIFDVLLDAVKTITKNGAGNGSRSDDPRVHYDIPYGGNKNDGGHDHRYDKGKDRTPAQREGDKKRTKDDE